MPFESKLKNIIEIINECFVLFQIYHLICFTDLVQDPEMRNWIGFSAIFFQCLNLAFNFGLSAFFSIKTVYKYLFGKYRQFKEE